MGTGAKPIASMVTEDKDNPNKDIDKLDIEILVMSPRIQRKDKNLAELNVSKFEIKKVKIKIFSEEEKREIVLKMLLAKKLTTLTILGRY